MARDMLVDMLIRDDLTSRREDAVQQQGSGGLVAAARSQDQKSQVTANKQ